MNEYRFTESILEELQRLNPRWRQVRVHGYIPYAFGLEREALGRDPNWKDMAVDDDLTGLCTIHVEVKAELSWFIDIDSGCRGEPTGNWSSMEGNSGDMCYSLPFDS